MFFINLAHADLLTDTCAAIKFAFAHGSGVSKSQLSHCHIVTASSEEQYGALLCHDHERDEARQFKEERDNVNILVSKGGTPRYMNLTRLATIEDVFASAPYLTKGRAPASVARPIEFYRLGDPNCAGLNQAKKFACGDQSYCFGSQAQGFSL